MSSTSTPTTNHEVIRLWAEDRGGVPACVTRTSDGDDVGVLRVFFPGQGSGDQLEQITWADFFAKFDEAKLAFLYEVRTSNESLSRFCKFIKRQGEG